MQTGARAKSCYRLKPAFAGTAQVTEVFLGTVEVFPQAVSQICISHTDMHTCVHIDTMTLCMVVTMCVCTSMANGLYMDVYKIQS